MRKVLIAATILLGMMYLALYLLLSRRGYAESDRFQSEGFYYFTPENTVAWRYKNRLCVILFWPLNAIDRLIGFGRVPAYPPLMNLSSRPFHSDLPLTSYTARGQERDVSNGYALLRTSQFPPWEV